MKLSRVEPGKQALWMGKGFMLLRMEEILVSIPSIRRYYRPARFCHPTLTPKNSVAKTGLKKKSVKKRVRAINVSGPKNKPRHSLKIGKSHMPRFGEIW